MKNAINENEKCQKLVKEIEDMESQLAIQRAKQVEVEKDFSNDLAVLKDYKEEVSQAVSASKTDDLKDINKRIQSIEKDINVKQRMLNQIRSSVLTLENSIKEDKNTLRTHLIWLVKLKKLKIEYEEVPKLLEPFLKLNKEFIDNVHSVFDKLNLKRLKYRDIPLNVRGSYPFVEHMSFISCPIPTPLGVVNEKTHQEHYEKQLNRFDRITTGKKVPKVVEPEKPEKETLIKKTFESVKVSVDNVVKAAMKVKPEEYDKIFSQKG